MDTDPQRFVTLFAPSDAAFKEFLQEIGRDNLAITDLDGIQVRKTMSDTIKFHMVEFYLPSSDFPVDLLATESSIEQHPTLLDRCVFWGGVMPLCVQKHAFGWLSAFSSSALDTILPPASHIIPTTPLGTPIPMLSSG